MKPGFHAITAAQYHADPCEPLSLSSSTAWTLLNKSPKHAWSEHPKLGKAVKEAQGWAVCFILKTQGRSRGYVTRLDELPP